MNNASIISNALLELKTVFEQLDTIAQKNFNKVMNAFKECNISQRHFNPSNGYGYDDIARDTLEKLFSKIMHTESAIFRPQIVSGTHALSLCLFGILLPGDTVISCTGKPYDTLNKVIGTNSSDSGSLLEMNVNYKEIDLVDNRLIDIESILNQIDNSTKLLMFQRSRGYSSRKSFSPKEIADVAKIIKKKHKDIVIMVDNCYGEFVCEDEPSYYDCVDITAGSLIKNPGGGIAPTGGYICGKKKYIERISYRLTAPSIGLEIGSYENSYRLFYQGLFMAPHTVNQALKTAILFSKVFENLGYTCNPQSNEERNDIVQAIALKSGEKLIKFCQALQFSSPIDSFVYPEPWDMPGYQDKVIMAAGTFVGGASIELTADGPMREPYNVYFQGGLCLEHAIYTLNNILNDF